jgi:hypothetical protein
VESLGDIALRRSDHDAARKAYLRGRSKQIGAYATLRECPMMGDSRSTPESGRRSRRRSPNGLDEAVVFHELAARQTPADNFRHGM